jgi:hypothetical protein
MVSKCANPNCSAPFRYLHAGKLFRVDTSAGVDRSVATGANESQKKPLHRVVFYWLCEDCAATMTLIFDKENGVSVCPRAKGQPVAA